MALALSYALRFFVPPNSRLGRTFHSGVSAGLLVGPFLLGWLLNVFVQLKDGSFLWNGSLGLLSGR